MTGLTTKEAAAAPAAAAPATTPAAAPAAAPQTPAAGQRPEWLPQGFEKPEDLVKAYGELNQKVSQPLDFTKYSDEFLKTGAISEASYKELEGRGISKQLVDTTVNGVKAQITQYRNEVHSIAGGEQNYAAAMQWASKVMSPAEAAAYDAAVESGNVAQAKVAVEGLMARYRLQMGSDPKSMVGGQPGATGPKPFDSKNEWLKATQDPKYGKDRSYTEEVASRYLASNF